MKEDALARAKQTDRAEVRRRYRKSQVESGPDESDELDDLDERTAPDRRSGPGKPAQARDARPPSGRLGFLGAFRAAYHPANLREDIAALPSLLRSRAFLGGLATLAIGIATAVYFRDYTGGLFALQLVVAPGSALLPQLVAGFFAPRASYLLGLLIGIVQGVAFLVLVNLSLNGDGPLRLGEGFTQAEYGQALQTSLLWGPVTSTLFAAGAAWYRRFLALSSPRGAARQPAKGSTKSTPPRRSSGR
jgi:hypothetical protein